VKGRLESGLLSGRRGLFGRDEAGRGRSAVRERDCLGARDRDAVDPGPVEVRAGFAEFLRVTRGSVVPQAEPQAVRQSMGVAAEPSFLQALAAVGPADAAVPAEEHD